jgi:hypothetical protein
MFAMAMVGDVILIVKLSVHCISPKSHDVVMILTIETELCYNLRFVQRNGRSMGDPWSVRQIGVYHKYYGIMRRSVWILVSASVTPQQIEEAARRAGVGDNDQMLSTALVFHAILLETTLQDWREYLDCLHTQLSLLVRMLEPFPLTIINTL